MKRKKFNLVKYYNKYKNIIFWSIFGFGLLSLIFIQYYGLVKYQYVVPPGDDPMAHYNMAMGFFEHKSNFFEIWKLGGYPPLYHLFVAKMALAVHSEPMRVILWTYPLWIVLAGLAVFFFAWVGFGKWPALFSFFVYGFITKTPEKLQNDGGYPNLIGASIWLPISFGLVILGMKNKGIKRYLSWLGALVFLILIMMTHHISLFEYLPVLYLFLLVIGGYFWKVNKWRLFQGLGYYMIIILGGAVVYWSFFKSEIFASARGLFTIMFTLQDKFPYFKSGCVKAVGEAIWPLRDYPMQFGNFLILFSFIGGLLILWWVYQKKTWSAVPGILLVIWSGFLLVASQLNFLINPERFARDASLPMSILAGVAVYYLFSWSQKKKLILLIFILLAVVSSFSVLKSRAGGAIHYNPMIRVTSADVVATEAMKKDAGGKDVAILTNCYNFYTDYFAKNFKVSRYWDIDEATREKLKDPSSSELLGYDYLYLQESHGNWLAPFVQWDFVPKFRNQARFEKISESISPTNTVVVYKVLK